MFLRLRLMSDIGEKKKLHKNWETRASASITTSNCAKNGLIVIIWFFFWRILGKCCYNLFTCNLISLVLTKLKSNPSELCNFFLSSDLYIPCYVRWKHIFINATNKISAAIIKYNHFKLVRRCLNSEFHTSVNIRNVTDCLSYSKYHKFNFLKLCRIIWARVCVAVFVDVVIIIVIFKIFILFVRKFYAQ